MLIVPKINEHIKRIQRVNTEYSPVDKIRLHASERDTEFAAEIWDYFIRQLSNATVRYYPNNNRALMLLSLFTGHNTDNLTIADGSDRILRNIFHVFTQPDTTVVTTDPAFPMYKVYADMFGLIYNPQPYTSTLFPYDAVYSAINNSTSLVVLSNPSSPVGGIIDEEFLRDIVVKCKNSNALLVIDEAYIEFSNAVSFENIAKTNSNVVVVRTTSKALGSAGARIGYSVASETNTALLNQIKSMNDISAFSIVWLQTLLKFKNNLQSYINSVVEHRNEIMSLCKLHDIDHIPSETNFLHISNFVLSDQFITKTCKFSWTESSYTRVSIPAGTKNFSSLLTELSQFAKSFSN